MAQPEVMDAPPSSDGDMHVAADGLLIGVAAVIVIVFVWLCGLGGLRLHDHWRQRRARRRAGSGVSTAPAAPRARPALTPDGGPVLKARGWARRFSVWTGVLMAVMVAGFIVTGLLGLGTEEGPEPGTARGAVALAVGTVAVVALFVVPIAALMAMFAWVNCWRIRRGEAKGGYLTMTPEEARLLYRAQRELVRESTRQFGGVNPEVQATTSVWGMQMRPDIVEEVDVEVPCDLTAARDRAQAALAAVGAAPLQEDSSTDSHQRVRGICARPSGWRMGAPVLFTVDLSDHGNGRTLAHVRAVAKYQRKARTRPSRASRVPPQP